MTATELEDAAWWLGRLEEFLRVEPDEFFTSPSRRHRDVCDELFGLARSLRRLADSENQP